MGLHMRLKFSPLYYEDGSPCYFRAGCLALFATCLILHVFLKDNKIDEGEFASQSQVQVNQEQQSNMQSTMKRSDQFIVNKAVLTRDSSSNNVNATIEKGDNSWSLFNAFNDKENVDEQKALLIQRKQAVKELLDGASFLAACGNINSSYKSCRFNFSDKVKANYNSRIDASNDRFIIAIQAKGQQAKDLCQVFVINSEGAYQAYDYQGNVNNDCRLYMEENSESFITSQNSKARK